MRSPSNVRQIELTTLGETGGQWDQARLGQVFSNLIRNALQYSLADSTIAVRIVGKADQVSVSVHNDGEPIPLDKQKSIFKPLTRGTDGGQQLGQSGLGSFHDAQDRHRAPTQLPTRGQTFAVALPRQWSAETS